MAGYASFCTLNGKILRFSDASIALNDVALMRGYGVFDFFRKEEGVPLFLDNYLTRFERSAKEMRLILPFDSKAIKDLVMDLMEKNDLQESGVRLLLTGGFTDNGYSINKPNFIILEEHLTLPDPDFFERGISLISYNYQRELPRVKSINYLVGLYLLKEAQDQGAQDILYHQNGLVREITRSNFFIVDQNNTVITSEKGVLHGITRMKVLELAKKRFNVEQRDFSIEELKGAREAFITGTTKKIMPVQRVDDLNFESSPGPITSMLMKDFDALVAQEIHK